MTEVCNGDGPAVALAIWFWFWYKGVTMVSGINTWCELDILVMRN